MILEELCGKGKFSVVYKAKRKKDNKSVALKKINVDVMDKTELDQCLKEVEMLQAVTDHPNIISYLDSFLEDEHLISKLPYARFSGFFPLSLPGSLHYPTRTQNNPRPISPPPVFLLLFLFTQPVVLEWAGAGDLKGRCAKRGSEAGKVRRGSHLENFLHRLLMRSGTCTLEGQCIETLKPANIFLSSDGTISWRPWPRALHIRGDAARFHKGGYAPVHEPRNPLWKKRSGIYLGK